MHHQARSVGSRTALRLCVVLSMLVLTAPCAAQSVVVSAQCNIYGAGHTTPRTTCVDPGPGPGQLPVRVNLPPGSICVEFTGVTGSVSYCGSCGSAEADGTAASLFASAALDGISGLSATRIRTLNGVFLSAAEPAAPAPATLTFTDFSFTQLSPLVAQQFVIGDGLTAGTGLSQRFVVPSGATRLYLGFLDGLDNCIGWWGDNTGSVSATVIISGISSQPQSLSACAGGLAVLSITAAGTGPFTYQWRKAGQPIDTGVAGNPSAATPTLQLTNITPADAASYDCVLTNPYGHATSLPATLTVNGTRCSPADIAYGDGEPLPPFGPCSGYNPIGPDGGDFDCFFNAYFESSPANAVCDIAYGNGDPLPPFDQVGGFNPGVDGGDFDCFFNFYFTGCL